MTSVLVIEDEKEIREMIVNHLKADHFNVVEAADGEEALAVSAAHKWPEIDVHKCP